MKRITLNGVHEPVDPGSPITQHRYYTVSLGNGTKLLYTSERGAKAMQAETDRWISAHLVDANFLFTDCFTTYRLAWLLLEQGRMDGKLRDLLTSAWNELDLAHTKCTGPNGWLFGWRYLRDAVGSIRTAALSMRDLFRKRNNPVERARMELLISRAQRILDEMAHYGSDAKGAVVTRTQ